MQQPTLAQALDHSKIAFEQLRRDYRPMLSLVRALIGVVPNCDGYLEIWPPAFRAYNLLVPNTLNLPGLLLGMGARKDLIGLAMYASSRAAECMYCSAHCCSFALRRGTSEDAILGKGTDLERAVVEVAAGLGQIPVQLPEEALAVVRAELSKPDLEWFLWAVALAGFLNKFMDAMGVELERQAISEVHSLLTPTGWTPGRHAWGRSLDLEDLVRRHPIPQDNIGLLLRVLGQAPAALRLEQQWTRGIEASAFGALESLERQVGYGFPRLTKLRHRRPLVALCAVLRDQLDAKQSVLGLEAKCVAGLVYAETVMNRPLTADLLELSRRYLPDLKASTLAAIQRFAQHRTPGLRTGGLSQTTHAASGLARLAGPSPSQITQADIALFTAALTPAQIIETLAWLGVLQLLHRLYAFDSAIDYLH